MNWFLIITLLVVIPAVLWLFRAVYELTDMVSRIMSKCYTIETTVNLMFNTLDDKDAEE